MILTLYKTTDADNVINKVLTDSRAMTINLKRDVDLFSPEILLTVNDQYDFKDYNHCYIDVINRHYHIRGVSSFNNSITMLELECDVLETYKADILSSNCTYRTAIVDGDYGDFDGVYTGRIITTDIQSDVVLESGDNSILNVSGWV